MRMYWQTWNGVPMDLDEEEDSLMPGPQFAYRVVTQPPQTDEREISVAPRVRIQSSPRETQ